MSTNTIAKLLVAGYISGVWISGGWLYAEDAECRTNARAIEDANKAKGIFSDVEGRNCGYGSMHLMPGTIGWPIYWFVRSSHEVFM
jgi:hypothetical protein